MCGPGSALGLAEDERTLWPQLKERLREPGQLMGLMRGVLGGETEVAVVVAVRPDGIVQPRALLATDVLADELEMVGEQTDGDGDGEVRRGHVGDYDVDVLMGVDRHGERRPIALSMSPWISQLLFLYSRRLWRPRSG